ncbi:periplasmic binding protein [Anaerovibrio sp. JC8]|uniref:ABC transporter substrate-binding protein n=1 Tax=Anaerovibrio sp. JC8 TaxID=1240085 RepID=UPI000A0BC46F|nr:ABC transporter substrate-binding protein [Anaerovibrio sp. JC8]ORU00840.1 periplasmic binding protein [Anaerovibrio sp. JC8]
MSFFKSAMILALSLIMLVMVGCGNNNAAKQSSSDNEIVVTDDVGREVKLPGPPQRIVVLSASFLEPLHLLGGNIVGRPTSQVAPDFAKDIAVVGKSIQVDVEKVLSLNPDLVVIHHGVNEKLIKVLEDNGIPSIVLKSKTYEDVKRELEIFGQVTGEKDKAAAAIGDMDKKIAAIKGKLPKEEKRVAVLFSSSQNLNIQLSGSIAGSVVKDFGWKNVAEGLTPMEKNPDATPYSMETMVEQNPEILYVVTMGNAKSQEDNLLGEMKKNPAWNAINAVQNNKVYFLPQDLFLLSPGLNYPKCYQEMAKKVYPELF